eukprot:8821990-Lingulodinium_polyedra.AAC.1
MGMLMIGQGRPLGKWFHEDGRGKHGYEHRCWSVDMAERDMASIFVGFIYLGGACDIEPLWALASAATAIFW